MFYDRNVFTNLSQLQPDMIIPDLVDKLTTASESLTEPHRFHACIQVRIVSGIYIMQNTMVRGGGKWQAGEKNRSKGGKMKKGKEKKEENYIQKGEKGLKNASFWAINSAPPAANFLQPLT